MLNPSHSVLSVTAGMAVFLFILLDMFAALQWAVSHPRVRVIVQSGEGKFFTAGLDLLDAVNDDPNTVIPEESIRTLE
ncbi:hypothetical protein KCU88_g167, partial [Aureobasidium melanogenum]